MEFFEMKFDETFVAVGRSNGHDSKEACKEDFENCARVLNRGSDLCKNGRPIEEYDYAIKSNQAAPNALKGVPGNLRMNNNLKMSR